VRRGRREEFAAFSWRVEPPDAQDEATFLRSKLDHTLKHTEPHQTLWEFYQELIKLRRTLPAFAGLARSIWKFAALRRRKHYRFAVGAKAMKRSSWRTSATNPGPFSRLLQPAGGTRGWTRRIADGRGQAALFHQASIPPERSV